MSARPSPAVSRRRLPGRPTARRWRAALVAVALLATAGTAVAPGPAGWGGAYAVDPAADPTPSDSESADAAAPCARLTKPVYAVTNPQYRSTLLTTSRSEARAARANRGYTTDRGVLFRAADRPGAGLIRFVRWWNPQANTYAFLPGARTPASPWKRQGTAFYAASTAGSCATKLSTFRRGSAYFFAVNATDRASVRDRGWKPTQSKGYVRRSGPDRTFSIAVMPDTQTETQTGDPRFANRTHWLVSHRPELDLRLALHTGDVVNWGWLDKSQFTVASRAMRAFERDGLPYALSVGNHDTRVVGWDGVPGSTGYGGSAYADNPECPARLGAAQCRSPLLLRHTEEFNRVFTAKRYTHVRGRFEKGKVDNIWSTYRTGGVSWLVLTLELWPRPEVVDWARRVVAAHPRANVIVQTHDYLDGAGNIVQSNGGYGATSPQYLADRLISRYPNIRLVLSGHEGERAHRVDTYTARRGGEQVRYKVASFLGNNVASGVNPVQLLEIDTRRGTVTSTLRNPRGGGGLSGPTYSVDAMRFLQR